MLPDGWTRGASASERAQRRSKAKGPKKGALSVHFFTTVSCLAQPDFGATDPRAHADQVSEQDCVIRSAYAHKKTWEILGGKPRQALPSRKRKRLPQSSFLWL